MKRSQHYQFHAGRIAQISLVILALTLPNTALLRAADSAGSDVDCDAADASAGTNDCGETEKNQESGASLPEDARAKVDELNVKLRYFKAIGFHGKSAEQRTLIQAIYAEHNVDVPKEYRD